MFLSLTIFFDTSWNTGPPNSKRGNEVFDIIAWPYHIDAKFIAREALRQGLDIFENLIELAFVVHHNFGEEHFASWIKQEAILWKASGSSNIRCPVLVTVRRCQESCRDNVFASGPSLCGPASWSRIIASFTI